MNEGKNMQPRIEMPHSEFLDIFTTNQNIRFPHNTPKEFLDIVSAYKKCRDGTYDVEDILTVALAYDTGNFVRKSPETCIEFLREAAKMDDPQSMLFIAERLSAGVLGGDKKRLFDPDAEYVAEWKKNAHDAWTIYSSDSIVCADMVKSGILFCAAAALSGNPDDETSSVSVIEETRTRIGEMMRIPGSEDFDTGMEWLGWLDNIPSLVADLSDRLLLPELLDPDDSLEMPLDSICEGVRILLETPNPDDFADQDLAHLAERYSKLSRPIPLSKAPDPDLVESILIKEFPWMKDAIDVVVRHVALAGFSGSAGVTLPPILLSGMSGAGKTRFANRVGEILGMPSRVFSAAGNGDSKPLTGTARGWSNAQPSGILTTILSGNRANPLIIIDELDKESSEAQGTISQALHPLLEPKSAARWVDECLGIACNLSHVSWILTCNDRSLVPSTILNRCTSVNVPRPRAEHMSAIIDGVMRDIASRNGRQIEDFPELTEADRSNIIEGTFDAREIRRKTENILADKARSLLRQGKKHLRRLDSGHKQSNILSFSRTSKQKS